MAITVVIATAEWQVVKAGPADVNFQNKASDSVLYATASSTPSDGVVLRGGEIHPVAIGEGESLYVRNVESWRAYTCQVVAIDA